MTNTVIPSLTWSLLNWKGQNIGGHVENTLWMSNNSDKTLLSIIQKSMVNIKKVLTCIVWCLLRTMQIQTDLISLKSVWKKCIVKCHIKFVPRMNTWAALSPDCYTQPEVQKGREVTTHKVCILIPIISSLEKYNRKIKLTDKVNWTSIFPSSPCSSVAAGQTQLLNHRREVCTHEIPNPAVFGKALKCRPLNWTAWNHQAFWC